MQGLDSELRPLREDDADGVVAAYEAAWGDDRPIDAEQVRSWFRNADIDPGLLRVLESGGRILGYGDVEVSDRVVALEVAAPGCWDIFLAWAEDTACAAGVPRVRVLVGFSLAFPERAGDPSVGWIHSLGVRPAWRGRGIGRALLLAAFGRLHARGIRRVGLGVDAGNETNALRLYQAAGMRIVRESQNWILDV